MIANIVRLYSLAIYFLLSASSSNHYTSSPISQLVNENRSNCQGNQNGDSPAQASEVGEKASNQILTLSGPLPGLHACLKAHQLLSVSQVAL